MRLICAQDQTAIGTCARLLLSIFQRVIKNEGYLGHPTSTHRNGVAYDQKLFIGGVNHAFQIFFNREKTVTIGVQSCKHFGLFGMPETPSENLPGETEGSRQLNGAYEPVSVRVCFFKKHRQDLYVSRGTHLCDVCTGESPKIFQKGRVYSRFPAFQYAHVAHQCSNTSICIVKPGTTTIETLGPTCKQLVHHSCKSCIAWLELH